eukprot:351895-Chlamydomonas_euryale.AAC.1
METVAQLSRTVKEFQDAAAGHADSEVHVSIPPATASPSAAPGDALVVQQGADWKQVLSCCVQTPLCAHLYVVKTRWSLSPLAEWIRWDHPAHSSRKNTSSKKASARPKKPERSTGKGEMRDGRMATCMLYWDRHRWCANWPPACLQGYVFSLGCLDAGEGCCGEGWECPPRVHRHGLWPHGPGMCCCPATMSLTSMLPFKSDAHVPSSTDKHRADGKAQLADRAEAEDLERETGRAVQQRSAYRAAVQACFGGSALPGDGGGGRASFLGWRIQITCAHV